MWIFDDNKKMKNKEVLYFAKSGDDEAMKNLPHSVTNNKEND